MKGLPVKAGPWNLDRITYSTTVTAVTADVIIITYWKRCWDTEGTSGYHWRLTNTLRVVLIWNEHWAYHHPLVALKDLYIKYSNKRDNNTHRDRNTMIQHAVLSSSFNEKEKTPIKRNNVNIKQLFEDSIFLYNWQCVYAIHWNIYIRKKSK